MAKEDRGFASMDRAKQREIASKGGKAAHQKGTAHEWTSEEARDAGRKGGIASHRRRREAMNAGGNSGQSGAGESGSESMESGGTMNDETRGSLRRDESSSMRGRDSETSSREDRWNPESPSGEDR